MEKVRYRVLKKCFVNGSLHKPVKGVDVFVDAAPGLEGAALEIVKATAVPAAPAEPAAAPASTGPARK